jgi:hypothetical protein
MLGWLHTKEDAKAKQTRGEMWGRLVKLPVLPAGRLIDWTFEAGPLSENGGAVSWSELQAWAAVCGRAVSAWELRLIRRISIAYGNARHDFGGRHCDAPTQDAAPAE